MRLVTILALTGLVFATPALVPHSAQALCTGDGIVRVCSSTLRGPGGWLPEVSTAERHRPPVAPETNITIGDVDELTLGTNQEADSMSFVTQAGTITTIGVEAGTGARVDVDGGKSVALRNDQDVTNQSNRHLLPPSKHK